MPKARQQATHAQLKNNFRQSSVALSEEGAKKEKGNVDIVLLVIVSLLVIFGMLMLFSASYAKSLSENGNSYYLISQQAKNLLIGIVLATFMVVVDYRKWRNFAWPAFFFAIACLIAVFFMQELNGARRWIILELPFGTFSFQPGEVAKFAIIIVFAYMLSGHGERLKTFKYGVLPFMLVLGCIAGLLLPEPHLSGTILVVGIAFAMMYAGGVPVKWLLMIVFAAAALVALVWVIRPSFLDHAFLRIETFRDLDNADPDASRQTIQSLTAIGSGGVWGRGLGKSRQKYMYLPEMHNDYIFAILCEEFGLVGALVLMVLFFALLLRCLTIARRVKDKFGCMRVGGVALQKP
ncbi:MAG: FtsW/RodA/SpoVE family cell cycle protein, partial [Oscillospiraceae bacterium]